MRVSWGSGFVGWPRRFDAGIVLITNYNEAVLGTPFGGFDNSGDGRHHAIETRLAYMGTKNIREPSDLGPVPQSDAPEDALG